ncbi:VWA domain-containing protein, partial [Arthrobacter sp. JCM 19049]|uniref:VWA domain-containing protein n=1 Tax=Arthrobacter sp. JCM 19049 TaxID=1460643 RepID=UPI000B07C51C
AAQADEPPAAELQPVMVVMDYSSSMLAKDADGKGTTRIDAAKKATKHLINNAPQDASMGLVVYGSKTPKKCDDITTVQKPGPVDKKELAGKLDGLKAVGETPIGPRCCMRPRSCSRSRAPSRSSWSPTARRTASSPRPVTRRRTWPGRAST